MKNEEREDQKVAQTEAETLLNAIRSIKGYKIITLVYSERYSQYEMDENGKFVEEEMDEILLCAKLLGAMSAGGGLTVRSVANTTVNGLSIFNMCGASLRERTWRGVSAEKMKISYNTDAKTGKRLPEESNVMFIDFSDKKS